MLREFHICLRFGSSDCVGTISSLVGKYKGLTANRYEVKDVTLRCFKLQEAVTPAKQS